jgi:hypothetical protein
MPVPTVSQIEKTKLLQSAHIRVAHGVGNISRIKAIYSHCEKYRYSFEAIWDPDLPRLAFMLHNCSTGTELGLDRTLRRCHDFTRAWGYGSMSISNRYAGGRSPNPNDLDAMDDPVGPLNDLLIRNAFSKSDAICCAWGNLYVTESRQREVQALVETANRPLLMFGRTVLGNPKHPHGRGSHWIRKDQQPLPFSFC